MFETTNQIYYIYNYINPLKMVIFAINGKLPEGYVHLYGNSREVYGMCSWELMG